MNTEENCKYWTLNIEEALSFFDELHTDSKKQATKLNALFGEELCTYLFQKYQQDKGNDIEILCDDGIPITPTKGTNEGQRLDRWLANKNKKELLQVEIKNWSAHSIGAKPLKNNILHDFARHNWTNHILDKDGNFCNKNKKSLEKVLFKMKPPKSYENYQIRPLLCLWFYVTNPEENYENEEPFFEYKINTEAEGQEKYHYNSLLVFSASAYLRSLKTKTIDVEMPLATKTIECIRKIFGDTFL